MINGLEPIFEFHNSAIYLRKIRDSLLDVQCGMLKGNGVVKAQFNSALDAMHRLEGLWQRVINVEGIIRKISEFSMPSIIDVEFGKDSLDPSSSDEGFLNELSKITSVKDGTSKLRGCGRLIIKLQDALKSFENKKEKLEERCKREPNNTPEGRLCRQKKNEIILACEVLRLRIFKVLDFFYSLRKNELKNILKLSEEVDKLFERHDPDVRTCSLNHDVRVLGDNIANIANREVFVQHKTYCENGQKKGKK